MSAYTDDAAPPDDGASYEAGAFGGKTIINGKPTYRSFK
jgi:hypothetical protein